MLKVLMEAGKRVETEGSGISDRGRKVVKNKLKNYKNITLKMCNTDTSVSLLYISSIICSNKNLAPQNQIHLEIQSVCQ